MPQINITNNAKCLPVGHMTLRLTVINLKQKTSGVQNVDCKAFLTDFLMTLKCKYNHP